MHTMKKDLSEKISELQEQIIYKFTNQNLLIEALTHPSVAKAKITYQRLEFLGNSILGAVLAEIIYAFFPEANEGTLSIIHSKMASTTGILNAIDEAKIGRYIIMDNGEEKSGGREKATNIEDCTEAIIGAIYLDGGYEKAKEFVMRFWSKLFSDNDLHLRDPKSRLQELCQKHYYSLPQYTLVKQSGLVHAPTFTIECSVKIASRQISVEATESTKKSSEQKAALKLLNILCNH
jgi:ribonuclease-3